MFDNLFHAIEVKLTGASPLLMHADKLADPLNEATKRHKEVSSKRKKTDEDLLYLAQSEWWHGMYYDDDLGPIIPANVIKGSLVNAAKMNRNGPVFKRAVNVLTPKSALEYKGTRDRDEMWKSDEFKDVRSVSVNNSRIMRYRPVFKEWSLRTEIAFNKEQTDRDTVIHTLVNAGKLVGIGDYRPQCGGTFGRFFVEVLAG